MLALNFEVSPQGVARCPFKRRSNRLLSMNYAYARASRHITRCEETIYKLSLVVFYQVLKSIFPICASFLAED